MLERKIFFEKKFFLSGKKLSRKIFLLEKYFLQKKILSEKKILRFFLRHCHRFPVHFLAHLVYQPKSLIQSCFVHCRLASALAPASVHTSPWHMVRHRNFILGTHMHICPPYMHIKYLMILTCSF